MGGLNTTLLMGMQALEATQGALAATSNNIANANTPGYTREVPQFSENEQSVSGSDVSGGGVSLEGLQSVRDELLNLQIQQQTSLQSSVDMQSSTLQQIQSYFSSTSGDDISSELAAFSSSLSQLSATPTSAAAQQGVISSGQDLANAFNNTANGLTSAQSYADGQVTQTVAQINSLTQQIAQLNGQLAQTSTTVNDGGTVEDQRDQLVQQLSTLTGISITQSNDGETITTGNGTPLVMGSQSFTLQTTTGSNGLQQVLDSNGQEHYRFDPGRRAGRSDSGARPDDPRDFDAVEHAGQPVCHRLQCGTGEGLRFERQCGAEFLFRACQPGECCFWDQRIDLQSCAGCDQLGWVGGQQRQCGEPLRGGQWSVTLGQHASERLCERRLSGRYRGLECDRAIDCDRIEPAAAHHAAGFGFGREHR